MGITITDPEQIAFNILKNTTQNARTELERTVMASDAYIKLLEIKYKAVLDPESGQLKPKKVK